MLIVIFWGCITLIGLFVSVKARQLSLRYNAWTTSFREKNPQINPPPTPEMRELNTKIMTRIFRVLGVFLVLLAGLMLIGSVAMVQNPH